MCDIPVSNYGFKFNLRRFSMGPVSMHGPFDEWVNKYAQMGRASYIIWWMTWRALVHHKYVVTMWWMMWRAPVLYKYVVDYVASTDALCGG
jgi:hypothetical protein